MCPLFLWMFSTDKRQAEDMDRSFSWEGLTGSDGLQTDATTRKIYICCHRLLPAHCSGSQATAKCFLQSSSRISKLNLTPLRAELSVEDWTTVRLGEWADLTKSSSSESPNVRVSFLLIKQLKQVSHHASLSDINNSWDGWS